MNENLVKVCCISSLNEAKLALNCGGNLFGFVSEMPSGPGVTSLKTIAGIVRGLPDNTPTILLTSKTRCTEILDQHKQVQTWGLQLVDKLPESELNQLRKSLPETYLIQVVHVRDRSSVSEALGYDELVDALLLDSGNPEAPTRTLGGTGDTHDWRISRHICEMSSLPVFLAGGLTPENISTAKQTVRPTGFDLCSGVRTSGKLDKVKLTTFMGLVLHEEGESG